MDAKRRREEIPRSTVAARPTARGRTPLSGEGAGRGAQGRLTLTLTSGLPTRTSTPVFQFFVLKKMPQLGRLGLGKPCRGVRGKLHLWSFDDDSATSFLRKICHLFIIPQSVQKLSGVRCFVIPWTAAHQASLSITNSQSFTQTHVHQVSDAIQPSHPLSSPSPPRKSLNYYTSTAVNAELDKEAEDWRL